MTNIRDLAELNSLRDQVRIMAQQIVSLRIRNEELRKFINEMNPVGRCPSCGHDFKDKQYHFDDML
jgi:rRNA maturation endonuclease Nob1